LSFSTVPTAQARTWKNCNN